MMWFCGFWIKESNGKCIQLQINHVSGQSGAFLNLTLNTQIMAADLLKTLDKQAQQIRSLQLCQDRLQDRLSKVKKRKLTAETSGPTSGSLKKTKGNESSGLLAQEILKMSEKEFLDFAKKIEFRKKLFAAKGFLKSSQAIFSWTS